MAGMDPIEHVIVLMLENRSFDQILGACQKFRPGIEGVMAEPEAGYDNFFEGAHYPQVAGAARVVTEDPLHDTPQVLAQLKPDSRGAVNGGFVANYATHYHRLGREAWAEVMRYHDVDTLPATHALARNFMVCDHWFASVPGPTWTNRLFAMSGTSLGRVRMPSGIMDWNLHWYDQTTLFDRLDEKSINWCVYFGDAPLSLVLVHQWQPRNLARHLPMIQFFEDVAGDARAFPAFALIEPAYLQPGANDGHAPHDVLSAEALVASVYNALRRNGPLWSSSLLLILFDEHGGFYDHVAPPATTPPDHHQEEYSFDRLGVRVPALLVSPWIGHGTFKDVLDHTSLLRYLTDKWGLGALGERTARAGTFARCINGALREDTPLSVPAVLSPLSPVAHHRVPSRLTEHQTAIVALSHVLESLSEEEPASVAMRSRQVLTGPQSQIDAAVDRFEAFLRRGRARMDATPVSDVARKNRGTP